MHAWWHALWASDTLFAAPHRTNLHQRAMISTYILRYQVFSSDIFWPSKHNGLCHNPVAIHIQWYLSFDTDARTTINNWLSSKRESIEREIPDTAAFCCAAERKLERSVPSIRELCGTYCTTPLACFGIFLWAVFRSFAALLAKDLKSGSPARAASGASAGISQNSCRAVFFLHMQLGALHTSTCAGIWAYFEEL